MSHNIESSDSITAAMLNDNSKLNSDELTLWQATHGLVFLGWYWWNERLRDLTEGTGRGAKCSFDIWLSEDYLMPGGSCLPFLEPMVQKERPTILSFKCTWL